jgi:hypothetical protein
MESDLADNLRVRRPDLQTGQADVSAWHRALRSLPERVSSLYSQPVVRENFPIVAIVAAYILAVYGVHALFGIRGKLVLLYSPDWFVRMVLTFSAIFIGLHLRKRSYERYFGPRYLAGFFVILILAPVYKNAIASFKQTIPLLHDFSCDFALMRLDQALHFGHHPWELLSPVLAYPSLLHAIDYLYLGWFPVLLVFCLWMGWTRRRRLRLHFVISTLLVWGLLGSVLGTLFSSAGPCYYSSIVSAAHNPFAPLMSRLAEIHGSVYLWALHNQAGLWQAYNEGFWIQFGGISAMPSVHLGMATVFALTAFNVRKCLGVIFVGYLCLIQIGSVILGWHYAIDGYTGIILAWLIWKAVGRMVAREI